MQCPICGSKKTEYFLTQKHMNTACKFEERELRRCSFCGHCFAVIPEGIDRVKDWYRDSVYSTDVFSLDGSTPHSMIASKIAANFPNRSIVDLGSGTGTLLEKLREVGVSSDRLLGVDFNTERLDELGIPRLTQDLNNPKLEKVKQKKYGVLTCMHVLEHLLDPVSTFQIFTDALTEPNAICYVEVPSHFSEPSDLFDFLSNGIPYGIQHIQFFSTASLALLLQKTGFNGVFEISTDISFGNIARLTAWARKSDEMSQVIQSHNNETKLIASRFRAAAEIYAAESSAEVLVWGVGSTYQLLVDSDGFLASLPNVRLIDSKLAGTEFFGKVIEHPNELSPNSIGKAHVLIPVEARIAQRAITRAVSGIGVPKHVLCWYDLKS